MLLACIKGCLLPIQLAWIDSAYSKNTGGTDMYEVFKVSGSFHLEIDHVIK